MEGLRNSCRLCLRHEGTLLDVFKPLDKTQSYSSQLFEFLGIQVKRRFHIIIDSAKHPFHSFQLEELDKWPTAACKDCVRILDEVTGFKEKVMSSQNHLRKVFTAMKEESEPQIDHEENNCESDAKRKIPDRKSKALKATSVDNSTQKRPMRKCRDVEKKATTEITTTPDKPTIKIKANNRKRRKVVAKVTRTVVAQLKCKRCAESFPTEDALQNHTKLVHTKKKTHFCEFCGKEFMARRYLRDHVQNNHSVRTTTECDICHKHFFLLKFHKRNCHGAAAAVELLVDCEVCGKRYKKRRMASHMRLYHSGAKFQCTFCDKEFVLRKSHKEHMNMHLGIRIQCYFCPTQATNSANLVKHLRQVHPVEYAEYREKKFSERRVLNERKLKTIE